jgi:hypothetical protein
MRGIRATARSSGVVSHPDFRVAQKGFEGVRLVRLVLKFCSDAVGRMRCGCILNVIYVTLARLRAGFRLGLRLLLSRAAEFAVLPFSHLDFGDRPFRLHAGADLLDERTDHAGLFREFGIRPVRLEFQQLFDAPLLVGGIAFEAVRLVAAVRSFGLPRKSAHLRTSEQS